MIYPSINTLMEKVDSRYTLVVVAAKRARQIAEGSPVLTKEISEKSVTTAINEIFENKIGFVRIKESIK